MKLFICQCDVKVVAQQDIFPTFRRVCSAVVVSLVPVFTSEVQP